MCGYWEKKCSMIEYENDKTEVNWERKNTIHFQLLNAKLFVEVIIQYLGFQKDSTTYL